jgi:hypothetical protein
MLYWLGCVRVGPPTPGILCNVRAIGSSSNSTVSSHPPDSFRFNKVMS